MEIRNRINLCGQWNLESETGETYQGNVPGCVHTDLFSNDEMYFEKNSENCRYIENQEWKYTKDFWVEELLENPILVFEGLDTYSEIYLNGTLLGKTDNMFITHRFAIDGVLKEGRNQIEVQFHSPIKMIEGKESLPGAFTTERLHSRRLQCTYGWDWVDRFVTCGIYQPAYITFENCMKLDNIYVFTNNIDSYSAQIKVVENFKGYEKGSLVKTEILGPNGEVLQCAENYCAEEQSVLYFDIAAPKLWYPRPYGEQPLYTLRITVGETVTEQRFGIRTVKILQLEDKDEAMIVKCKELQQTESGAQWDQNEKYSGFILLINGKKIYCTGANWVPCEPFPSAETETKITKILETAVSCGINMVRVWGGGLFEQQHFYDECDRLGIMVTQDFLMACGNYPEKEAWFQEQLRKEAEFAAVYLRNHPSLVWWTGDNENAVEGCDTDEDYQGRTSARKIIAAVLEKLDYNRVFLFSSPYGGKKYASKTRGTTHNTQFLETTFKYMAKDNLADYREFWKGFSARFIAEEPVMGAVPKQSLKEFMLPENQDSYELWLHHTKNNPALGRELMDMMMDFAEHLFGKYKDWEDKYFKLRYLQYEWIRFTLSNIRSDLWFNSGIIYWMLDDCWPAALGWSIIDYYMQPKAGYYAVKHFGQPVNVNIEKRVHGYEVIISNILGEQLQKALELDVFVLNFRTNQKKVLTENVYISVREKASKEIAIELSADEILIAEVRAEKLFVRNWYKEDVPQLQKTDDLYWKITEGGIEVWADRYIHAVDIEGTINASDNYFSLLPGEKRMIQCNADEAEVLGFTF